MVSRPRGTVKRLALQQLEAQNCMLPHSQLIWTYQQVVGPDRLHIPHSDTIHFIPFDSSLSFKYSSSITVGIGWWGEVGRCWDLCKLNRHVGVNNDCVTKMWLS